VPGRKMSGRWGSVGECDGVSETFELGEEALGGPFSLFAFGFGIGGWGAV
jgi:hypothetical protein